MRIQSIEDRLREVDRVIMNTSEHGCTLIRNGAPLSDIEAQTEFLRHLYHRRDTILNELKRAGVSVQAAYEHIKAREDTA